MAVYKVIQDVEAEDKLLGPLTFKGFVYALIAGACAFINFRLLFVGTPLKFVFIAIFLAPMVLFGVLASPLGREQPTEVWLLSRIRFFLKPRRRIWDQSGMMDLVMVTVPKKQELHLTKDLSQDEVQSRLKTLAMTLDTRGWAIKNVDVNLHVPEVSAQQTPKSDRLVGTVGLPQQTPVADIHAADDILDEKSNPTAQKFDALMQQAEEDRRHSLLTTIKGLVADDEPHAKRKTKRKTRAKKTPAHTDSKELAATKAAMARVSKESAAEKARRKEQEDAELAAKLEKARASFTSEFENGHLKVSARHRFFTAQQRQSAASTPTATPANPVTAARQADTMELAQSGSAFSVSTLSQLANRQTDTDRPGPDDISVPLQS